MSEPINPEIVAEPAKPAALWEDFVDIFYAPSQVFERRRNSGFFLPMVIVTLLLGGLFLANSGVLQPMMDAEMSRQMAATAKANPQLTPAQMEQARSIGATMGKVGAFVFAPIAIFFVGLFWWIIGKMFGATMTLAQGIMVASYSFIPRVVEAVVAGVQGLLLDPATMNGRFRLSLGVGRFFDPDTASPVLLAIVGRIDVFTIWITVLLVIGLSVTGKIPRSKAAIAGVVMWIAGGLFPLLGALRAQ